MIIYLYSVIETMQQPITPNNEIAHQISSHSQWSWATKEALAILAVDNLSVDAEGLRLLKAIENGQMTCDEAIAQTLREIKTIVHNQII